MRRRTLLLAATALLLPGAPLLASPPRTPALRLAIHRDVHADYLRFLGRRDALTLTEFGGNWSRRDVVETVLLQQALARGDLAQPLRFVIADSYGRLLKMLSQGDADLSASSAWKMDADDHPGRLAVSRAVIGQGRFEAGLYFPEGHEGLEIVARDPHALADYTAVCSSDWRPDILTLQALGVKVLLTENWNSMLGMLRKGRADFVLAPFQPNADFRISREDLVLLPVEGVKVGLVGSRHFLVSQAGSDWREWLAKLNRGLLALEKEDVIARAYEQSGFHDSRVQEWRRIGPGLSGT